VVSGTGGPLAEPVEIQLLCFGSAGGEWTSDDGRDGFDFMGLPSGQENPFLFQATYLGITYNSQFHLHTDQDTTLIVTVYDTTSATGAIGLEEMEIDLTRMGGDLRIDQILQIANRTDPPKTIVRGEGTVRVFLPVPAEEAMELVLAASRGIVPIRRDPIPTENPREVAIDYPIRPGFTAVAATYLVSYPDSFAFRVVAAYDVPQTVLVAPSDMVIASPLFAPAHAGGEGIGVYTAGAVAAGDEIVFDARLGSTAPQEAAASQSAPPGRVFRGTAPFAAVRIPVILLIAAVLFVALLVAVRIVPGGHL